jgi:alpha-1,2-mannosyltransferase
MRKNFTNDLVPQYKEKLHGSLKRFFQKIKPNAPVERNNYFIQTDSHLPWSSNIGPEDSFGIGWDNAREDPEVDEIHFRTERQTLRRLPRSGGVLFTIRTYMLPVREMCQEKWVPGRFASAIRSWGDDVARYKGLRAYKDVSPFNHLGLSLQILLPFLDKEHERQIREGIIPTGDEGVEDTAYPFSGQ